jgi:NhaP-type Na+/H+ or K+/H+ antiporter
MHDSIIDVFLNQGGFPKNMSNWEAWFRDLKPLTGDEIMKRVRRLESHFKTCFWILMAVMIAGWVGIGLEDVIVGRAGMLMVLVATIAMFGIRITVQMELSTLRILSETVRRQEEEMRRSMAEDL